MLREGCESVKCVVCQDTHIRNGVCTNCGTVQLDAKKEFMRKHFLLVGFQEKIVYKQQSLLKSLFHKKEIDEIYYDYENVIKIIYKPHDIFSDDLYLIENTNTYIPFISLADNYSERLLDILNRLIFDNMRKIKLKRLLKK